MIRRWCGLLVSLCLAAGLSFAGEPPMDATETPPLEASPESSSPEEPSVRLPVPVPTLGGGQFWGDVLLDSGYRIQHYAGTEETYRLLSPMDVRLAAGTFEDCRKALRFVKERDGIGPMTGEVVVVIHGILRSSKSMSRVAAGLRKAGYTALSFDYPSSRVPIEDSAEYLRRVIENIGPKVTRISFVVHSMGGLLMRTYLRDAGAAADPRLHRLVMLGVPNHGANLASMLKNVGVYRLVFGPAGQQLIDGSEAPAEVLPTPPFEFAVIAGSRGTDGGFNPLVPGDDDGTVAVSSARLKGAKDFLAVRGLHSSLMFQSNVVEACVRFVESGCLHASGECDPIR